MLITGARRKNTDDMALEEMRIRNYEERNYFIKKGISSSGEETYVAPKENEIFKMEIGGKVNRIDSKKLPEIDIRKPQNYLSEELGINEVTAPVELYEPLTDTEVTSDADIAIGFDTPAGNESYTEVKIENDEYEFDEDPNDIGRRLAAHANTVDPEEAIRATLDKIFVDETEPKKE